MFRRTTTKKKVINTNASPSVGNGTSTRTSKSLIATTDYAQRSNALMDIQRELMAISVSLHDIDLPRVVVIGGQSSGKSSLVEAVSGITVPRDSGICTRCPMICNMSTAIDKWSCTIELCCEYDSNGSQITNSSDPISFGGAIHDKTTVELWIRRAQAAILSPHRDPAEFLRMSKPELKSNAESDPDILQFSRNSVRVNVSDPDATNISFVDLPGLVQNADKELIDLVRSLVESHIDGQNTIVVVAMPMTDDMEMMQGVTLAKDADPERQRTIGVLTKPDAITKGATGGREKWKAVLEGREHTTQHGYFCVRLPDEDERAGGITTLEAQRLADAFFSSTEPWSLMDRSRFGVPKFVARISELLIGLLEQNLQKLKDAMESALGTCLRDIAALPPPLTSDASTETIGRINSFCRDLCAAIQGEQFKYFVQRNTARYVAFKADIERTTPDFRPFEDVNDYRSRPLVSSGMEPQGLPYVRDAIGKSITWELTGVPFEAIKNLVTEYTKLWSGPSQSCFEAACGHLRSFVDELIGQHFGQYETLSEYVSAIILEEIGKSQEEARRVLRKILEFETTPLYTQNRSALEAEERQWFQEYHHNHIADGNRSSSVTLQYTFPDGRPNVTVDVIPSWQVTDELKVMATVQAYFQVAYKRIVDNVPLAIEHELHQALSNGIEKALLNRIFQDIADDQVDMKTLLRENPELEARRNDLLKREECLRRIKEKLDLLEPQPEEAAVSE